MLLDVRAASDRRSMTADLRARSSRELLYISVRFTNYAFDSSSGLKDTPLNVFAAKYHHWSDVMLQKETPIPKERMLSPSESDGYGYGEFEALTQYIYT
jgi:hypothetical protein